MATGSSSSTSNPANNNDMTHNNKLKVGDLAPNFKAKLWNGETFELSHLKGKKVWLAFFRHAGCPLCNLRVHEMIVKYDQLKEGLNIVAVFQSPASSIAEYAGKQNPPFPLIADPNEELYKLYKVTSSRFGLIHPGNLLALIRAFKKGFILGRREGTATRVPADFLIEENGTISTAFYGEKVSDHIPFDNVMSFVKTK